MLLFIIDVLVDAIIATGTIYAFANPTSPDAGLDSGNGTYINGGLVIATGNMVDAISNESKQNFIYASFRSIGNLLYSSPNLNYKSYEIYTGGSIDGEDTNGLYTKINNYTGGEEITFNSVSNEMNLSSNNNISKNILLILIIEIVLLGIFLTIYIVRNHKIDNTLA